MLVEPVTLHELFLCGPRMTLVFLKVRRVLMVLSMGFLPRPVWGHNRSVSKMAEEIIDPFVVRETSMAAVMSHYEQGSQEHAHNPVPEYKIQIDIKITFN